MLTDATPLPLPSAAVAPGLIVPSRAEPASVAAPLSVFVPVTGVPGFVTVTGLGAVLSMRRASTTAEVVERPALSVAIAWKSYSPSGVAPAVVSSEQVYTETLAVHTLV